MLARVIVSTMFVLYDKRKGKLVEVSLFLFAYNGIWVEFLD